MIRNKKSGVLSLFILGENMKKLNVAWIFALIVFTLAACAASGETNTNETKDGDTAVVGFADFGADSGLEIGAPANSEENRSEDDAVTETDKNGIPVGFTEDGRPYKGNPRAPVVIEEFSDYQCPYCGRFVQQTLPDLTANQIANGDVMFVFYDYPLSSIHPQAVDAANAARCAGEQGAAAYWKMHDAIFNNESQWANNLDANAIFINLANEIGLDMERFTPCQESGQYYRQIQEDYDLGVSKGVSSTPSFFINGQPLIGAQPLNVFNAAIASAQSGETIAAAPTNEAPPSQPAAPGDKLEPAAIDMSNFAAAIGDPDAPVTIVEFTDYQCPFCQRHSTETMPALIANMIETGRVYYVVKDFPLDSIHAEARAGAMAARCAGEQDAYWQMHDAIFKAQSQWAEQGAGANAIFADIAASLELDVDAFTSCQESGRYDDQVQANVDEGVSLGVRGTPFFFIDGYPINGAQPYDLFEYAIGLAEAGTLADAYTRPEPQPEPTAPAGPVDVPTDDIAFAIGDPGAAVTIVEYTDYQCPYCARHFQQTFPRIKENYVDTGQVYYVFKDFPLTSIHAQAVDAAEAARCAGEQGAYLEMHNALFLRQQDWADNRAANDVFVEMAGQIGLDADSFAACLESGKYESAVMADLDEGVSFGVRGTPAFFINGNFLSGAQPYDVFVQAISQVSGASE